jgi:hypothetical protein
MHHCRNSGATDRNACASFFELTVRAPMRRVVVKPLVSSSIKTHVDRGRRSASFTELRARGGGRSTVTGSGSDRGHARECWRLPRVGAGSWRSRCSYPCRCGLAPSTRDCVREAWREPHLLAADSATPNPPACRGLATSPRATPGRRDLESMSWRLSAPRPPARCRRRRTARARSVICAPAPRSRSAGAGGRPRRIGAGTTG